MSDVAIFVEDPGAIAFVSGVPEALRALGYTSRMVDIGDDLLPALAVVVGTGEDRIWPSVLEVARRNNVPTVALIDSCTSVEHRAAGLRNADYIAVPDEDTRQAYIARGFDPARVRACGHPRHDALYAMREERPTRWPATIMFATELSSSCDPLLNHDRRTEAAMEAFLAAVTSFAPRPRLVLRLHPKTPRDLYQAYLGYFDIVSDSSFSAPAILAADLVVGLTSSILDEALILGRRVLTVAKPEERVALAGWRHGLVSAGDIDRALFVRPDLAAVEAAFPRGGAMNVARLIADAIMAQVAMLDDGTVRLEPFADRHVTARYVGWLNDPETVRYSEQRHRTHTLESCAEYRRAMAPPNKFWAIIAPPFGHVGNIAATVDKWNRTADLAILVERAAWGRGIGKRAWNLALDWLLGQGGMLKVTAGTMAENKAMRALMRDSGMIEEGRSRSRFLLDGVPVDGVWATKDRGACPNSA